LSLFSSKEMFSGKNGFELESAFGLSSLTFMKDSKSWNAWLSLIVDPSSSKKLKIKYYNILLSSPYLPSTINKRVSNFISNLSLARKFTLNLNRFTKPEFWSVGQA
jgi:hypothetical protein